MWVRSLKKVVPQQVGVVEVDNHMELLPHQVVHHNLLVVVGVVVEGVDTRKYIS